MIVLDGKKMQEKKSRLRRLEDEHDKRAKKYRQLLSKVKEITWELDQRIIEIRKLQLEVQKLEGNKPLVPKIDKISVLNA